MLHSQLKHCLLSGDSTDVILSANLTIKIFWYSKGGARSTKPASGFMKRACVLVSL